MTRQAQPIQMLLSGTASGVIGAARIAAGAGARNVLSFDVGGTSADVAIIVDGKPRFGVGELVGEFPIYIPTVSVTSIGAGGGSIARVDDLGVLKVGPESAGANPGPACYGRGGTRATITDAYAVCGLLGRRRTRLWRRHSSISTRRVQAVVGDIAEAPRARPRRGGRSDHQGLDFGHVPRGLEAVLAARRRSRATSRCCRSAAPGR